MNYNKSKMRCKRGFTLIELLVVVLIIGILAAVAVPQYQKAVLKTRYRGMLPILKSVVQAQEMYYLVNNKYADSWEELDVDVPSEEAECGINNGPQRAKCLRVEKNTCMCLGVRGEEESHTVMIAFARDSNVISTDPSGYEYVLEPMIINQENRLDKGLYCRENNYSGSTRTDYHCDDGQGHKSWFGSWFKMD